MSGCPRSPSAGPRASATTSARPATPWWRWPPTATRRSRRCTARPSGARPTAPPARSAPSASGSTRALSAEQALDARGAGDRLAALQDAGGRDVGQQPGADLRRRALARKLGLELGEPVLEAEAQGDGVGQQLGVRRGVAAGLVELGMEARDGVLQELEFGAGLEDGGR